MTTDITELAQSHELRNKVNHRLYGALEFQGTSGENATITLSIDECKSIIAAMDERLALVEALEKAQAQQKFSFSMTQNEMEKYAEMYRSDNNDSSSAFLPASEITWIEGFLSPHAFSSVFTHESATNWLNSEVKIHKGDQIADTYIDLQKNPAVNPVVVVFQKGKPMIWDGYHRIAAAIIRGRPIYAIFSISLLEPLVLATELESRTVKLPQRHSMLLREDFNEDYHTEMAYKADEVQASLAAAGIKVEAE